MAKRTMPPEWYASQAARRLHNKALKKTSSAPYIKQASKERKLKNSQASGELSSFMKNSGLKNKKEALKILKGLI